MVGGLELATLVFMDLKAVPGGPIQIKGESYEKMNNYIVDTGYGLERFVWASKGSPTIYDAIFPDLVRKVADLTGVEHNLMDPEYAEIFAQNARLAGMVDLDEYSMLIWKDRGQHRHLPEGWKTIEPMEDLRGGRSHPLLGLYAGRRHHPSMSSGLPGPPGHPVAHCAS
jgi:hypothetical protein